MLFWFAWAVFSVLGLYGLAYAMVCVARRYAQLAVDGSCFEEIKAMREQNGTTTSDLLSEALASLRRDWARKAKG